MIYRYYSCFSDEAERKRYSAEPDRKKHLRLPGENIRSDHRQEVSEYTVVHIHKNTP